MQQSDLSAMFRNGKAFRRYDVEKECGCSPNRIYHYINGNQHLFVLVILQSRSGPDYPASERGMARARLSINRGRVSNAYLVFADRDPQGNPIFVFQMTLGMAERTINGTSALNLREDLGPCWFFDRQGQLVRRNMTTTPKDDYEL